MGNICRPTQSLTKRIASEEDFGDYWSIKRTSSTVFHDRGEVSPGVSHIDPWKQIPSSEVTSTVDNNPVGSPIGGTDNRNHFYEDTSLQRYLLLRSFLPNSNSALNSCPEYNTHKDSVLLVVKVDGLSEMVDFVESTFCLSSSQAKGSTSSLDNNTANSRFHHVISGYFSKIIHLIAKEHGGTIESIKGDKLLSTFQTLDTEKRTLSRQASSFKGSSKSLLRTMKSDTQRRIESCRRAAQCGHFLTQKIGKYECKLPFERSVNELENDELLTYKSFTLSLRCAVVIGKKIEMNIGHGSGVLWKRILLHDAIHQIAPVVENDPDGSWEYFGSFMKSDDDNSSEVGSSASSPPITPSFRRLNSVNLQSFRNISKVKGQSFEGCFVSDEVRNYISTYFSLQKISLPDKKMVVFKVLRIKDWFPVPEEMKDDSSKLVPIPEEILLHFAPAFLQKDLRNEDSFQNIALSASVDDISHDVEELSSPSPIRSPRIRSEKQFSLIETSILTIRFDYLNKEDEGFIQFQIFQYINNLVVFAVDAVAGNTIYNVHQGESGVEFSFVFQDENRNKLVLGKNFRNLKYGENPSNAAIRAALLIRRLNESINDLPVSLSIGVGTGYSYLGIVGSDIHRSFVFIGRGVENSENLAVLPGQIVVDAATYNKTQDLIQYLQIETKNINSPEEARVKNIDSEAYLVIDLKPDIDHLQEDEIYRLPCFVNESKLLINHFQQFTSEKEFYSIAIIGKQGSGKTEILRHLMNYSKSNSGLFCVRRCQLKCWHHDRKIRYSFLSSLMITLVTNLQHLTQHDRKIFLKYILRVEHFEEYEPYLDLLNPIFNLNFPKSNQSKSLTIQQREEMLYSIIYNQFIIPYLSTYPTLLTIDDIQNMDEASEAFLNFLLSKRPKNLFLVLTRATCPQPINGPASHGNDSLFPEEVLNLKNRKIDLVIPLHPLTKDDLKRFITSMCETFSKLYFIEQMDEKPQIQVSPKLIDYTTNSCQGSLYLVDQCLSFLSENNYIEIKKSEFDSQTYQLSLKESLPSGDAFNFVTERLKVLPSIAQKIITLICILSISSSTFDESTLCNLLQGNISQDEFNTSIQILQNRRFIQVFAHPFRHFKLQSEKFYEELYVLIPNDEKKVLHQNVAKSLENMNNITNYHDKATLHLLEYASLENNLSASMMETIIYCIKSAIKSRYVENDLHGARKLQDQLIQLYLLQPKSNSRDIELAEIYLEEASILEELGSTRIETKEKVMTALNYCPHNSYSILCAAQEKLWHLDNDNHVSNFNFQQKDNGWSLVKKMHSNALKSKSIQHIIESIRCACRSLFLSEKYEKVCTHAAQALDIYRKEPDTVRLSIHQIQNQNLLHPVIEIYMLGCIANWLLARTRTAHFYFCSASEIYTEQTHPKSKCFYLLYSCVYSYLNGDIYQLARFADDALHIVNKHQYIPLKNHISCFLGYARLILGATSEGQEIIENPIREGINNYSLFSMHIPLMYTHALISIGGTEGLQKAKNYIEKEFESKEQNLCVYLQAELYRMKGIIEFANNDTEKALSLFEKGCKLAKGASLEMISMRCALKIVELLSNVGSNDESATHTDVEKRLRDKYISILRKIQKEITNEDFSKDMMQYSHKYTDPEEIEKLNGIFPEFKKTFTDLTWKQPNVENLRQNGIMFDLADHRY